MWIYKNEEFTPEMVDKQIGMVYIITNLLTGRKYIGKKLFQFKKTKQVKLKKKKILVQSDWMQYYGSNEELKNDVAEYGTENFHREIIHLCNSKAECSFLEAKEQFLRDVLLSDDYYNSWISVRIRKAHLKSICQK